MLARRGSSPTRCGTTPSSGRASTRSSRSSSAASPCSTARGASAPSASAAFPARSTSSWRSRLSNDLRVGEDVGLVAASRRELRDDRALVAGAEGVQRVGRDRELVAGAKSDLAVPFDPEEDTAGAAAERLLLSGLAGDRRMAVLRAQLAGEEHELLRADAFGVHVDDELEAGLLEPPEPEVGDLDLLPLRRRQDDARLGEHLRGPFARFLVGHNATGVLVVAEVCSASSDRACAIASSRPRSGSPLPRIASLRFSSSSR